MTAGAVGLSDGLRAALAQAAADDRIAALIGQAVAMQRRHPQHVYDSRARRVSVAVSVAIGRAAPELGRNYSALITTWNAWGPPLRPEITLADWARPGSPDSSACSVAEWAPHTAPILARLADAVADHLAASVTDLLDGGATVRAWRYYATLLRRIDPVAGSPRP